VARTAGWIRTTADLQGANVRRDLCQKRMEHFAIFVNQGQSLSVLYRETLLGSIIRKNGSRSCRASDECHLVQATVLIIENSRSSYKRRCMYVSLYLSSISNIKSSRYQRVENVQVTIIYQKRRLPTNVDGLLLPVNVHSHTIASFNWKHGSRRMRPFCFSLQPLRNTTTPYY
jgi:hypothetical protein